MILAFLFARATAATFLSLRPSRLLSQLALGALRPRA
jgi:hypothetical protein